MGREHGLAAVIALGVIVAFALTIRALWNKNQELHKQIAEQAEAVKKMGDAHASQLRAMAAEHAEQLKGLTKHHALDRKAQSDEYARQLLSQAGKINELQERRVEEMRTFTEKVITYIGHIDAFANKLEATIDVLLRASGERR
jgi:hypothetical protein